MSEIYESNSFEVFLDIYNGITINNFHKNKEKEKFEENINNFITELEKDKRNLLWIHLDIKDSKYISFLTSNDFKYHTCHENSILLVKRLIKDSIIPTASNHTLGVGVIVINDKNEILLIKERYSNIGFKLPGGHIDDGELIQSAVIREVKEETGIDVEFESIMNIGHFYPHQFDKSNMYILCKANAKSSKIQINDTNEIIQCEWIDLNTYLNDENTFEYIKEIVKSSLNFSGLEIKELEIFKSLNKNCELFFNKN